MVDLSHDIAFVEISALTTRLSQFNVTRSFAKIRIYSMRPRLISTADRLFV